MSNPIDLQTDILSEISEYLYVSAPSTFEEASCIFEYDCEDDGSWSVGSKFSYKENGIIVSDYLNDEGDKLTDLVAKLHAVMLSHTAGKWSTFTISVKNGGPANVKFKYE
ncbi:MAG: hypothetical protein R3261_11015 [Alphaproteobacteria bacterium]|nr:hypothetical protein [Alphaproteobacteria bacterium]